MTNVFDMASEDADAVVAPSDAGKAGIAKLAARQVALAEEISILEARTKELKKDLQRVEEQDLPEAMDAIGMSEFALLDGTKISIKTFYNASITAERKEEAFTWLDENGHGGLIKTEVKTSFGRDQLEIARAFQEFARGFNEAPVSPELDQSVHWQTLRGFVKDQIEGGGSLPVDLLGIYIGRKAHLKAPKN